MRKNDPHVALQSFGETTPTIFRMTRMWIGKWADPCLSLAGDYIYCVD